MVSLIRNMVLKFVNADPEDYVCVFTRYPFFESYKMYLLIGETILIFNYSLDFTYGNRQTKQ